MTMRLCRALRAGGTRQVERSCAPLVLYGRNGRPGWKPVASSVQPSDPGVRANFGCDAAPE
eukprot:753692-Hanusia_phi.AAC.1